MGGLVSAPQDLVPARRLGAALRALVTKYFRKTKQSGEGGVSSEPVKRNSGVETGHKV